MLAGGSGRYRHDDIPKEMVVEIYKRELAKLRHQTSNITERLGNLVPRPLSSCGEQKPSVSSPLKTTTYKEAESLTAVKRNAVEIFQPSSALKIGQVISMKSFFIDILY